MKKFRIVKFIPYGENEVIEYYDSYKDAERIRIKTVLSITEDCEEPIHVEGKINGEWYALCQ